MHAESHLKKNEYVNKVLKFQIGDLIESGPNRSVKEDFAIDYALIIDIEDFRDFVDDHDYIAMHAQNPLLLEYTLLWQKDKRIQHVTANYLFDKVCNQSESKFSNCWSYYPIVACLS